MRARVMLVPLLLAVALVSGCANTPATSSTAAPTPTPTTNGVDALSADEILKKAIDALEAASSFRIKGSATSDGTSMELDLLVAGDDVKGTIKAAPLDVEIVKVGSDAYMKAGESFWTLFLPESVRAMALPLVVGKFVKVPAAQAEGFVPEAESLFESEGTWKKDGTTTVNGKPAVVLTDGTNKVHVSLDGKPYPLNIVSKEGTLEILEVDAGAKVTAPPAAEVLDLSTMTK